MNQYKHFILKFLSLSSLALGLVFYFNYSVDPHNRYHFSVAASDLKTLSDTDRYVLTVPGNYDDRLLLKQFIQTAFTPRVAVIGGSRVVNVLMPEQALFLNAGVTGAMLKDYIAIWQIMKQSKKIPKIILLGLDPPALNSAAQNNRWLSLSEYYQAFFKTSMGGRYWIASLTSNLADLLSFQTLIESFRHLGQKQQRAALVPVSDYHQEFAARTFSFSMIYPASYEQKSMQEVNELALAIGVGERKAFKNWNLKEKQYFDDLSLLLADMKQHNVQIIVILLPYHPLSLTTIQADPLASQNLAFLRNQLEMICRQQGIFWHDGFKDTESDLFNSVDFSDGVHLKARLNYEYFRSLLEIINPDKSQPTEVPSEL